jgi:hypothetical protein
MYCKMCKIMNPAGSVECDMCGHRLEEVQEKSVQAQAAGDEPSNAPKVAKKYTISISANAKYAGGAKFDIIANDMNQGKVEPGKTLVLFSDNPILEVKVATWGSNPLKVKFQIGENAHADIGMWKKNIIVYSVAGAEIVK